ncbi:methyltransferase family protein [Hydrogenivirga caldilitoris]|uniref:Methyltransferase family protein n=1 Tax=Hydrogenivirga caldilitoris TaxID=246264 RepID=A0A497XNH7_9AQUI|nr:class I SAM-dependent methyltransferase [Hydrogenivirga caldilitoris]RLJ70516.1 methyltransferase family protein [Hydrogenivirga caldilitoris]
MAFKFPEENWHILLSPERESWQSIQNFLRTAEPKEEEVWADIGCGPGYFTLPLARRVRRVYAIDSSDFMLSVCFERAKEERLGNVEVLQCTEESIPLENKSVDVSLLANLFHELLKPDKFMEEVRRITRSKVILIDWHPVPSPAGPPIQDRVPKESLIEFMESRNFKLLEDNPIYPYHYFLVFKP